MNAPVTIKCPACNEPCDALYGDDDALACGACVDRELAAHDERDIDTAFNLGLSEVQR